MSSGDGVGKIVGRRDIWHLGDLAAGSGTRRNGAGFGGIGVVFLRGRFCRWNCPILVILRDIWHRARVGVERGISVIQ